MEVSGWQALDIAHQIVERCAEYEGHQILMSAHTDQAHTHVHIVINAVNTETGKKFQFGPPVLRHAKAVCNEITKSLGLSVPVKGKTYEGRDREQPTAWSRKTYEMLQEGERIADRNDKETDTAKRAEQPSYIRAIGDTVVAAMGTATSREAFISAMDAAGISTSWTDNRKHMAFTDRARAEAGEKKCKIRQGTLNDHYNLMTVPEGTEDAAIFLKTELENEFTANAERRATGERCECGTE